MARPGRFKPLVVRKVQEREVQAAFEDLLAYCRSHDWAGHDPYDALNSRVFSAVPLLDTRLTRLLLTQILKRSPIDLRALLLVPRTSNPKALALLLSAALKAESFAPGGPARDVPALMIQRLIATRSTGNAYWCWGYSFPWQTRTVLVPKGAPNVVCTTFVAGALLDAYEQSSDAACLRMAASAADFLLEQLYRTGKDGFAGFSYPLPGMGAGIHNANLLAAALLARLHRMTGHDHLVTPALRVARYTVGKQRQDGSWPYGEATTQRWVDNFHTGYNLCALWDLGRDLDTSEFEPAVRRGLDFYVAHFFREDGAPRYFHNRTHPIDIHSVAQSLITLTRLQGLDTRPAPLASQVLRWALTHMWDSRGFFYYRILRLGTIRTSYMRWSQAWMLLALATMLEGRRSAVGNHPLSRRSVPA